MRAGKLRRTDFACKVQLLAKKTISKTGRKGYQGAKGALKASQILACHLVIFALQKVERLERKRKRLGFI